MTVKTRPHVVLIGPLPIADDVIGGTKVNFAEMVRQFESRGRFQLTVINTSRNLRGLTGLTRLRTNLTALAGVLGRLRRLRREADFVLLNVSPDSTRLAVPLIHALCRLWRLPLGLRFFGGNFGAVFDAGSPLTRLLARRGFLKSPLILMQTQALTARFAAHAAVSWFPNTRDLPPVTRTYPETPRKLLFLAQVRPEKGYREAMACIASLHPDTRLHLYGPDVTDKGEALTEGLTGVTYHGPVDSADVPSILAAHDLLLFPSYFGGEGYPGVILEALQCGTPVVATRWMDIPEVLPEDGGGLLVPPRDVAALTRAVASLQADPEAYARLCARARTRGAFFRSEKWYSELEERIAALIAARA